MTPSGGRISLGFDDARTMKALITRLLLAMLALPVSAQALDSALPSAELFYKPPAIEQMQLSPSGRWLAMSTGLAGGRIGLVVFDLRQWRALDMAAHYNDADIEDFAWVNDDVLVYQLTDRERGGGDQRMASGLFSVRRDGTVPRTLVKLTRAYVSNEPSIGRQPLEYNHELLLVPGVGDEVIVGEIAWDANGDFRHVAPKRLNAVTGSVVSLAAGMPDNVWRWIFDAGGEPRVAVSRHAGREIIYWRGAGATDWRKLAEYDTFKAPWRPRFVDHAGELLVTVPSGKDGTTELKRFDFATGKPEADAMVSTPGFDFSGELVTDGPGGKTLGVRVLTDAETTVWSDQRLAALQQQADHRLPGHVNRLDCRRCEQDDMTVLVRSWSDTDPGQVWVYFAKTQAWRKVGDMRPGIDPQRMGRTDFHRIRARDGLQIPVWVTHPAGAGKAALPAVVLVHGGPWVRGWYWRWNADAQFLASRGYVVIEPEFRGSTGYGTTLFNAGIRQWGRAMQDDLADSLAWAVAQGWVDAKRVCIAGASYGGYATLMGLIRHPDLYRCGIAWAAVTDPRLMFKWRRQSDQSAETRDFSYPRLIGDPVADAQMLDSVSPVLQAGRIKAPVLLAFGGSDRRVPLIHGTTMLDALIAAGNPPDWVLYPDEGHGWYKLRTRLDFAQRMQTFLATHLK